MTVLLCVEIASADGNDDSINVVIHHKISDDTTEFENESGEYMLEKIKGVVQGFSSNILLMGGSITPLMKLDDEEYNEE